MPPARRTPSQQLLWHHKAHERWTGKRLAFWFFTFRHSYEPRKALPALDEVADELWLTSFASYELLGAYDIMARLYMSDADARRLREAIRARPELHGLKRVDEHFFVAEVVRHWPWGRRRSGGALWTPEEALLKQRPPERELMILNALGASPNPEAKAATEPDHQQLLARYVSDRLIALRPSRPGIKLVIRIARDGEEPEDPSWRDIVRDALSSALDRAGNLLDERSLYAAEGNQPVVFLIMCRVSFENFHRIRSGFVQQVRQAAALAGARTMTLVAVSPDFHCFRDAIPEIVERTPIRDYRALLRRPEGQELEVKGSVLASVDPWLKGEAKLVERDDHTRAAFLKTLVGFLNSAGGTLVIGALETHTYQGRGAAMDRAIARYRRSTSGPHFCIGLVDPTCQRKGWDKYVLKLRKLIADKISPAPGVLIDFRPARVGGREIGVVTVYDPGEAHDYYLEEDGNRVYYARQGPETKKLSPEEIPHHREATHQRRLARRNGHS